MSIEINNLDETGGWGAPEDGADFFAEIDKQDSLDPIDMPDPAEVKAGKDKEEEEEEAEADKDLFTEPAVNLDGDDEEDEDEDEDEDKDDKKSDVTSPNILVLNSLKEKGIIDYELEEGEELTDELAAELIEDKFEESVEERIKELTTALDPNRKDAVQFLLKGGNLQDLIEAYSNDAGIDLDVDLEDEDNQLSTARKLLFLEGKDEEEVETELDYLKTSGKLKSITEKKFAKHKAAEAVKQSSMLANQAKAKENERQAIKDSKAKVETFLTETEEVGGLKFSKEDKVALPGYMNDKAIKLNNGSSITSMQADLFYNLPKNEKAFMQLATLLRNRNEDGTFNFSKFVKKAETKVVEEVRKNVRRGKTSIPEGSSTKDKGKGRSLASYF